MVADVDVELPRSEDRKLIYREHSFEVSLLIWPRYINVTDKETDRWTDERTTYCSNTAHSALRGKKRSTSGRNMDKCIMSHFLTHSV